MEHKMIFETNVMVNINNKEYEYDMTCYDGYAFGVLREDTNDAPNIIKMEYPTLNEVLYDMGGLADDILQYRGLCDLSVEDLHYGDVMMYMGEVVNLATN